MMKILTSVSISLLLASRFVNVEDLPPLCILENNETVLTCSGLNSIPHKNWSRNWNNITTINFCYNNFTTLKPNTFQNKGFDKLEVAILCYSNISNIERNAFNNQARLWRLNLNGNKIRKLKKYAFTGLSGLRELILRNNQIASLETDVFELLSSYLDILDLSYNSLTNLPKTLLSDGSVTHLDVSDNRLVFEEKGPILISDSLNRLVMRSCNLKTLPVNAFSELPNLEVLDLSRNELTVIRRDSLAPLAKLQSLDLSNNLIFQLEYDMLSSLKALVDLNCEGNSLEVIEKCVEFLKSSAGSSSYESKPTDCDRQTNNSIGPPSFSLTFWFLLMLRIFADLFF